jgi:hypothetical protein
MNTKSPPEVVASCFSDGEDQTKMCKAQRVNELADYVKIPEDELADILYMIDKAKKDS